MRKPALAIILLTATTQAQFQIQDSHSTASLRGIHSIGNGVAWASGTEGTILRTTDDGATWQRCSTPPEAEKLDFRGIQAFDQNTAIVMSSGKGDLSRLYKTTDACKSWKLVFTNPDKDGFFDALRRVTEHQLYLLGDPVKGKFSMFLSTDMGDNWFIADDAGLEAESAAGAFAASNSSLTSQGATLFFATGGASRPFIYVTQPQCSSTNASQCSIAWTKFPVPMAAGKSSSGIFALSFRSDSGFGGSSITRMIAIGGTYDQPDQTTGTVAVSNDGGETWTTAQTPPHGYRSSVAYDHTYQTWITVGPNGTDISHDDGKNWTALKPTPQDTPDADKNWNALSLPFVVGPKGHIGKLRPEALKP
jgi:photosystem II stability/assembly factor-like uncharacterized protein